MTRTCSKCGNTYPATGEYFYKKRSGFQSWCKSCDERMRRDRRAANPEKYREAARRWRKANPEKMQIYAKRQKEYQRKWGETNSKRLAEKQREWRRANPEYDREWRRANPEKARQTWLRWYEKRAGSPSFRLNSSIRARIGASLKGEKAGRSWEYLVGYTLADLIQHLEAQFTKGMTWENYGAWHIDHIKPISHFHFESTDDPEFLECWSLWNLQPLWAFDNFLKNDNCDAPPLPLLHGEGKR